MQWRLGGGRVAIPVNSDYRDLLYILSEEETRYLIAKKMKPGLKTLITGIALFILGGFVIPFLLILPLFLNESTNTQFLVPGSKEVTVEKPGRYYLWNDF
ncbi:MAG TPA: hypothetical protein PLA50_19055, partial [Bacteroidia bacterium]|nr:hypothetical protein [Bacteroidia bacterium]